MLLKKLEFIHVEESHMFLMNEASIESNLFYAEQGFLIENTRKIYLKNLKFINVTLNSKSNNLASSYYFRNRFNFFLIELQFFCEIRENHIFHL